jgi:hypothetical protein
MSKEEESQFVNDLRVSAASHNLVFLKWQATSTDRSSSEPPKADKPDEEGPKVIAIKANVEVKGTYENVRAMIDELVTGSRYVIVESASWDRINTGQSSKLSIAITRFVEAASNEGDGRQVNLTQEHGGS